VSELKVEAVAVEEIIPHPNADRLDVARIKGWYCVVQRDSFRVGDIGIYFPIDSVLPDKVEGAIFGPDSKIKLDKHRVRTIKLRGVISQGLLVRPEVVGVSAAYVGEDFTEALEVKKYEPPVKDAPSVMRGQMISPKRLNPLFSKYTDLQNIKNYPSVFHDGEPVVITEKLHGTSSRYGILPTHPRKWWQKVLKFLGLLPKYEFVFGSRNVQLQDGGTGFYSKNVYRKIKLQYDLKSKLLPGECIYGEIVGDGIQKGYTYGCGQDQHRFYAYDVMKDGKWLDPEAFFKFCFDRDIPAVPVLYVGPYSAEIVEKLKKGDSTIGGQLVREGVVIKPAIDTNHYACGRKVLKAINEEYLLRDNTDFH